MGTEDQRVCLSSCAQFGGELEHQSSGRVSVMGGALKKQGGGLGGRRGCWSSSDSYSHV